ncbi:MAG: putative membrane protein SpoIIM required for sporulation [Neolewinella sp.]|jgi:uncharacterized membrane protein SpoIIM required for sporulation
MRETEFIEKNKEKWTRYERALDRDDKDPKLLNELYIHTTDDLSYSRTFYPNRSVRVYLNSLAQKTFLQIYRGRRGEAGRFITFWTDELPRVVHNQRFALLLSLGTFVLAMLIGIISYQIDPSFAEVILGEGYVEMTKANIENGDPMAVYKGRSALNMSLSITLHNTKIAFLTFISGAFFAVGSLFVLISNGIMVGVFQYFFYDQGLFQESFLTIWIHGALEISSIVIAGGAGLAMGRGLIFPGTLSRFDAFKISARDGLKIMLGIVPLLFCAGFLEGYITRHTELPDAIRAAFIATCFAFIIWYYIIYPWRVSQRPALEEEDAIRTSSQVSSSVKLKEIRTPGENLSATFDILRRNIGLFFGGIGIITLVYTLLSFTFFGSASSARYFFDGEFYGDFINVHELTTSFSRSRGLFFLLLVASGFYSMLRLSFELFWRATDIGILPANWRSEAFLFLASLVIAFGFAWNGVIASLFVIFLLPTVMTFAYAGYAGLASLKQIFSYIFASLATTYSNFFIIILMAFLSTIVLTTTVGTLLFSFLDWVIYADPTAIDNANVILQCIVYYFIFAIVFCIWAVSFALNFYHLREIVEADGLLERIESVGSKRRIRGMETE